MTGGLILGTFLRFFGESRWIGDWKDWVLNNSYIEKLEVICFLCYCRIPINIIYWAD